MLTNITTAANSLKPKLTTFSEAEGAQLITTKNRHLAANALYDEMNDMCETAIIYYQDRDKLKASMYIIYDSSSTSQQRNGSITEGQTVSREFDTITADSNFKMRAFEGNDLQMYFSNTEAGNPGTASIIVISNGVDYKTATAAQLGYNGAAGYVYFCIRNSGAMETGYRVVME
jgi:phage/plasmid-associated DNA primase